jgi:hypothetical protein
MDNRAVNKRIRKPDIGYKIELKKLHQKGYKKDIAIRFVNFLGVEKRETIIYFADKLWAPTKKLC